MVLMRIATLSLCAVVASAAQRGFNYGATFSDGAFKHEADFVSEFNTAKNLVGAPGLTSARLYTMIQGDSNGTIEAIAAAIKTQTPLLLGLWASAGDDHFGLEAQRLRDALQEYGTSLAELVIGISVGSEDLYRASITADDATLNATRDSLVNYISMIRSDLVGTALADCPVGHVDTYNTWINTSYSAPLVAAVDFIGVDAYPYYEGNKTNGIANASEIFWDDYSQVVAVSRGKEVWVTETSWPVQGPQINLAVANVTNAAIYYQDVGCQLFASNINTWWYILQDQQPALPANATAFGVVGPGNPPPQTPVYSLTCLGYETLGES